MNQTSNVPINKLSGFVLVDKPQGVSSFGAVYKVRLALSKLTGQKYKVGHSGTLDPAATGLLLLAVGKSTKQLPLLIKKDKTYQVELTLGSVSTTDDSEGEITVLSGAKPTFSQVQAAVNSFLGDIMQTPPIYSAIKVNGQRAYKLARKGETPAMQPRPAKIISITGISYQYPQVVFTAAVSSGTYIRSLAKDIGAKLGTGAYMSALRRTAIGNFSIGNAAQLADISEANISEILFSLE